MTSEENKKRVIKTFIRMILNISDKNYQRRVWIRGEGPEVDDFVESVCNFFDFSEFIFKDYKAYGITEKQYSLLIKFHDKFDEFCDGPRPEHSYPPMFIDTPEWNEVVDMAAEVLKAFNDKKP